MSDRYRIVGPVTYRGKPGCTDPTCTRLDITDPVCFGWHCAYCDEACSQQGHDCDVADTILKAAANG